MNISSYPTEICLLTVGGLRQGIINLHTASASRSCHPFSERPRTFSWTPFRTHLHGVQLSIVDWTALLIIKSQRATRVWWWTPTTIMMTGRKYVRTNAFPWCVAGTFGSYGPSVFYQTMGPWPRGPAILTWTPFFLLPIIYPRQGPFFLVLQDWRYGKCLVNGLRPTKRPYPL